MIRPPVQLRHMRTTDWRDCPHDLLLLSINLMYIEGPEVQAEKRYHDQ